MSEPIEKSQVWRSRDSRDKDRTVFITGRTKDGKRWHADSAHNGKITKIKISEKTLRARFTRER